MTLNKIPLAGVVGSPVAHSRSPQLHGHWLHRYGLKGFYIPLDVAPDDLEMVLRTLPKAGFVGVNITVPHKEQALKIADEQTDRSIAIGAANTLLFREDGSILADNTDGFGFIHNLRQGAPDWQPAAGPAAVLGAGGAARAIIHALLDAGVSELRLSNRTRDRADALRAEFGSRLSVVDWADAGDMLAGAATVVNTTSLGMLGKPELTVPLGALDATAVVTDIVYAPLQTQLLQTAGRMGCTTVDGLGMLLHQAVPGFESWFGKRPTVDEELRKAVLA